jgi:hypothetical protein
LLWTLLVAAWSSWLLWLAFLDHGVVKQRLLLLLPLLLLLLLLLLQRDMTGVLIDCLGEPLRKRQGHKWDTSMET